MWCARRRPSALGAWDAASAWRPVWKASLTRNCAGPSLRALASRARRADRVHASASVHPSATVGAGAVVGPNAWVGPKCVLGPNVVVGAGVIVGGGTVVGPNTTLLHCALGAGCTLHAGVNIGADGFGFIPGIPASTEPWPDNAALTATAEGRGSPHANRLGVVLPGDQPPIKKPQLRRVVIGDDVEIGAGSCIDRGSWRDTVVGHHTKLDNLVQVGHNVHVGVCVLLCAQVALGGSSNVGDFCVLGGRAAVADHVSLASGTRVAACSGVTTDVLTPGTTVGGFPAVPVSQWRREVAWLRRAAAGSDGRSHRTLRHRGPYRYRTGEDEAHDPPGA